MVFVISAIKYTNSRFLRFMLRTGNLTISIRIVCEQVSERIFFKDFFFECVLPACMLCATCIPGVHEGQKRTPGTRIRDACN